MACNLQHYQNTPTIRDSENQKIESQKVTEQVVCHRSARDPGGPFLFCRFARMNTTCGHAGGARSEMGEASRPIA